MRNYLLIMRPSHWTKNIFVFVGLIFGGKLAGSVDEVLLAIGSALGGFFCFSLAAASIYIINDIIDRDADKIHPEKCNRPIAAGVVPIGPAVVLSAICAFVAIVSSYMLARSLSIVIVTYIGLMLLYSLILKRMMILDCITISIGFCLRAVAGAIVVGVFISPWLIICTFALCLFLGFGKRRSEVEQIGEDIEAFRRTLAGYTPELLAHMLDVTSGLAIVCFLLYATDARTLRVFGTNNLVYTTPLVLYCIFRFSALIQKGMYSGPVELTLRDRPFQIGFALWVLSCIGIIYANKLGISLGGIWAY
ncbi:MAG: decaprenyl-phosphate phosphoribosyltransferase [Planctomycetota bacterium]|nr:MAG: decaprenyl-phosphate phosphoribosyltransferase [Planctomycetota bacterium]